WGRGVLAAPGPSLPPVDCPVRPQRYRAQVVVVADAPHDEVLALGCRFRRRCAAPAVLRHPLLRLGHGAVIHRDVVAALVLEVPRHGVPHDAETEKSHLRHTVLPRALPCDRADAYMRE